MAAAQSGSLSWPQYSTLKTTVSGPGTLVFWWKVYQDGDLLFFSASGTTPQSVGTFSSWQMRTVYLGTGNQTLQWAFQRSPIAFTAQDVGWLDQVSFVAGGTSPIITSISSNQIIPAGTNITFQFSAIGTPPLNAQWQLNGTNIVSATNSTYALTNAQALDSGVYSIVISNNYGLTYSNISLTVLRSTPQFIGSYCNFDTLGQVFQMQLNGLSGHGPVVLYSSTNLVDWLPVFTNPPVMGLLELSVSNGLDIPFQFYRVGEQ